MATDETKTGQDVTLVRARPVVENIQPLFDTAKFEHFQRAATALMNSTLLSPSVRGSSPAECFSNLILIFETAERWNMPATALAQCVSLVHGKLMFEGKVITAMLEATLGVRLHYHWTGERGTPAYRVYVSDKSFDDFSDEVMAALAPGKYPKGARMIDGSVGDWQTFQKDNRTPNPAWTGAASRNQLAYRGSREWARLYEPGRMLGVYGDDEVMAWQEERDARLVAPATSGPAISTGFARAAPETLGDRVAGPVPEEPAIEAEFTAVDPEGPQEGAGQAEAAAGPETPADPATSAEPQPAAAATPSEPKTPRKTAAQKDAVRAAETSAATRSRMAACEVFQTAGRAAGLAGEPNVAPKLASEEEAGYWRNGWVEGDAQRPADKADQVVDGGARAGLALEAFEAGHEAGLKGEPGDVPRPWANIPDDFAEGWNAGAAERLQDAADEETPADEEDDEFAGDQAHDEPDAFERFQGGVRALPTWGEVKTSLNALSRSDDWKAAAQEAGGFKVRQARISAGLRLSELQAGGKEPLDVQATDLTAFRCWMETVEDPDLVLAKWQELVQSPACQALDSAQRGKMESTVKGRMQELRQPKLDPSI